MRKSENLNTIYGLSKIATKTVEFWTKSASLIYSLGPLLLLKLLDFNLSKGHPMSYWMHQSISSEIGQSGTNYLRDEVKVWDEGALKNDGDIGRVEELDWVRAVLTSVLCTLHRKVNTESLKTKIVSHQHTINTSLLTKKEMFKTVQLRLRYSDCSWIFMSFFGYS